MPNRTIQLNRPVHGYDPASAHQPKMVSERIRQYWEGQRKRNGLDHKA